jgi:DNA-binding Xre family transcriptional regulator
MTVSYNRLWKLLIDKKMTKRELRRITQISPSVIAKMGRGQCVATDSLLRICVALDCDFGDIMEVDKSEPVPKRAYKRQEDTENEQS